jgi:hypothetical protein
MGTPDSEEEASMGHQRSGITALGLGTLALGVIVWGTFLFSAEPVEICSLPGPQEAWALLQETPSRIHVLRGSPTEVIPILEECIVRAAGLPDLGPESMGIRISTAEGGIIHFLLRLPKAFRPIIEPLRVELRSPADLRLPTGGPYHAIVRISVASGRLKRPVEVLYADGALAEVAWASMVAENLVVSGSSKRLILFLIFSVNEGHIEISGWVGYALPTGGQP